MTLEPSSKQRSLVENLAPGKLALAQFLAIKDQDAFAHYRSASERAVSDAGGQRTHNVFVDQVLAGGEMCYSHITVDVFPSPEAALTAFDAASDERQAALADIYVLTVRPKSGFIRVVKALGFLSPLFGRIVGTTSEKAIPDFDKYADPETGPYPETVAVMRKHDQRTPFYMMNLNKYYPQARYENGEKISGEEAYSRYGMRIIPYLISVRGYPDIIGHTEELFVSDEKSPLHDNWSEFAMVYYPSRAHFLRMMTNSPRKGVHHRSAGLQRAVLMPSSDIPQDR